MTGSTTNTTETALSGVTYPEDKLIVSKLNSPLRGDNVLLLTVDEVALLDEDEQQRATIAIEADTLRDAIDKAAGPRKLEVDYVKLETEIRRFLELAPASIDLRAARITDLVRDALAPKPPAPEWHGAKVVRGQHAGATRTFMRAGTGDDWITDSGAQWSTEILDGVVDDIEILVPGDE